MGVSNLLSVLFLTTTTFVCQVQGCNYLSSSWCDNENIATQCEVLEPCTKYVWNTNTPILDAPPVNLGIYYEVLCIGCREIITSSVFPTWQKIGDIMNITLVPYGNTKEHKSGDRWVFKCQHGEQECIGNEIESCAIHIAKDIKKYFPFIYCMESHSGSSLIDVAKKCAQGTQIPIEEILQCQNSSLGNQIEHEMGVLTENLKPPHYYAPWVTLNGKHTEDIQKKTFYHLLKLICDTYTGTKPAACFEDERGTMADVDY